MNLNITPLLVLYLDFTLELHDQNQLEFLYIFIVLFSVLDLQSRAWNLTWAVVLQGLDLS